MARRSSSRSRLPAAHLADRVVRKAEATRRPFGGASFEATPSLKRRPASSWRPRGRFRRPRRCSRRRALPLDAGASRCIADVVLRRRSGKRFLRTAVRHSSTSPAFRACRRPETVLRQVAHAGLRRPSVLVVALRHIAVALAMRGETQAPTMRLVQWISSPASRRHSRRHAVATTKPPTDKRPIIAPAHVLNGNRFPRAAELDLD